MIVKRRELRTMFKGILACVLLVSAGVVSVASAQLKGGHRGLLVGGMNIGAATNWMLQLDARNQPTTLRTDPGNPNAPWPTWGNVYGMTMDVDNRTVLIPGIVGTNLNPVVIAVVRYDPIVRAVVGTLWQGVSGPTNLLNWSNFTLNSDGDLITIDNAGSVDHVAEFDRFAGVWRRHALPVLYPNTPGPPGGLGFGAGVAGCEWDEFRGGIHHVTWAGPGHLFSTSWDYSVTTTLSQVIAPQLPQFAVRYGGTMLDNQDWVSSMTCAFPGVACSGYAYSQGRTSTWFAARIGSSTFPLDVTHEKYAAPGVGFWIANWFPQGVRYIDVHAQTAVTVYSGTAATWPGNAAEVLPLYDRDLATLRTGKATWDLFINPGAGALAGKPYIAAASLKPAFPGIKLPDGRELFLGLDSLSQVTSQGALPPFLTGNTGQLNATGKSVARIDLTTLGRIANGSVIHFAGVVLDPAAPCGIAWVFDPHAFVVDVLP